MNKIEIIGRLKSRVKIGNKEYQCNDVNLDKDFLIDFTKNLLENLGQCDNKIEYEKFFDEEIISKIRVDIIIKEQKYNFIFSRDTFEDKVLIGCEMNAENTENNLFGMVYDIKISLIKIYNRFCENSNIFLLQDFNNEQICQTAYVEIHKVENRLRSILTRYLMKKYGKLLLSKSLKKEVDDYSKWFRKEVNGKYKTFKRINIDYANIDFLKLLEILELKDSGIINKNGDSVESKLFEVKELLNDDMDADDIFTQFRLIEQAVNNRKYVFDDKPSREDEEEAIDLFGSVDVITPRDILHILDEDFKECWKNKLSKMRNMIAHNKPICKDLYDDIIEICKYMHKKFDECDEYIEEGFYSDEEGVRSALEDMEMAKERDDFHHVEELRESIGIEFPLSKEYVETELAENCTGIKKLMDTINGLEDIASFTEDIGNYLLEIKTSIDEEDTELDSEIRKKVVEELKLEIEPADNNMSLILFIEKYLFKDLNVQNAIQYYSENENYLNASFDYFDLNFKVGWYDTENKIYSISVNGEVFPDNGGIDEIQFILNINDIKHKAYCVQVNYGDYYDQYDGNIDDSQLAILVDEIENSVKDTIEFFIKVHNIMEEITELF